MKEPSAIDKLMDVLDKVGSYTVPGGSSNAPTFKTPMGWCKVCGAEREMDLWYHGAGRSGFGYFPCDHSSHHEKGDVDVWKDEYDTVVPEDKLIQKGA